LQINHGLDELCVFAFAGGHLLGGFLHALHTTLYAQHTLIE
jgi:hypothetical protein